MIITQLTAASIFFLFLTFPETSAAIVLYISGFCYDQYNKYIREFTRSGRPELGERGEINSLSETPYMYRVRWCLADDDYAGRLLPLHPTPKFPPF